MVYHEMISDIEIEHKVARDLKLWKISPQYLYLWDAAYFYYWVDPTENDLDIHNMWELTASSLDYFSFIKEFVNESMPINFVSLWCWNSKIELELIKSLMDAWYKLTYWWVDISKQMLDMSSRTLDCFTNLEKHFVHADFTSLSFLSYFSKLLLSDSRTVRSFLWRSITSQKPSIVVDSLFNLMNTWDLLWLDALSFEENEINTKRKLYQRYESYMDKNHSSWDYAFYLLSSLWIKKESVKMNIKTSADEWISSASVQFSFLFLEKCEVFFRWEKIYFLPWDEVDIMELRTYIPSLLKNYLSDYGFLFKGDDSTQTSSDLLETQFLFEKI